ncbi:MAG: hypothetical protein L3J18_08530 [Candidatus Brocadia sp.]|uniref:Pyruvate carboxylase n=1 Tax=Candidatus Brocadia fulgida TaxID=380242 RepID=A0A0M2UPZ4_9BACT|nr:MAG: pyruvate carboxylase [Candidatus Brocadia fulgida]UJS22340.1 MAG: hypothetical protein L3J18_08530 [Candidatus Brocadia sp.]
MQYVVSAVDRLLKGFPLVMKVEATIYAEHDGEIGLVLIGAKGRVGARNLLADSK